MRAFVTAVVAVALSTVMLMSEKAPSEDGYAYWCSS